MASIHREILIEAPTEKVWAALRNYGGAKELVPDLLRDCQLEGDTRTVTFMDGRVAHEILVSIDDDRRRVAYAEPGGRFLSRSASIQVFDGGEAASRVVWINDVLPNGFAELIARNMEKGLASMKDTLERFRG